MVCVGIGMVGGGMGVLNMIFPPVAGRKYVEVCDGVGCEGVDVERWKR